MVPAPADGPQAPLDLRTLDDNEDIGWLGNGRGVYVPWVSNQHSIPGLCISRVMSIGKSTSQLTSDDGWRRIQVPHTA
jgi:hypothetical protein